MSLTAIIVAMTIAASTMGAVPVAVAQAQITEAQAKEMALKDAGLKEAEVTFVRSNIDYDDGVMEYEVEFFSGNTEYDYDIDAVTGAIRARDFDCEFYAPVAGNTASTGAPAGSITQDQAVDIALKHAGLTKADVSHISKLDSIQKSIDQAASDIKSTTKDTVVLGNYGTILNKLDSIANTVNDDIKDIQKRTNLTEEQKSQEIAKLYTSRSELRTQIDLAAKVFNSDTMDEPSGRSLYKVLYDNIAANPNVYTSGDAIDKSTPYLTKAMGQFVKANAVLDELMTQYEKVNGANSLKATRGKMDDRFIGSVDKSGKVTGKGMLQKYEEFFKQDRHKEIRSCGGGATGQW